MTLNPTNCYCFNPRCVALHTFETDICLRCGAALQLRQRYRAIQVLGQGKFSRTVLAINAADSLQCVIQQRWNPDIDVISIAQLRQISRHPQLTTVLDGFEQEGIHYLVQDYIQGESLAMAIARQTPYLSTQIWQILESLLPVLHWLHTHDVTHRDIKPANILQQQSSLFLVDFGSALLSSDRAIQTVTGSSEYTAPEQLQGNAIFASDLYSLGVVCIHALTGVQPFHLFDSTQHQWVWRTYWQPEESNEKYPDRLTQILDRLIAPTLVQRFASAAAAITQIEQLRGKKIPLPSPAPFLSWQNTATFTGHSGLFASVTAVALAPDRRHLASASEDKTVRLWDIDTAIEIKVLKGHSQFVQAVAFHPHQANILISAGRDRQILIWDWQTAQVVRTLTGHTQPIPAISFSSDGNLIASGSADKTIKLWTLAGELIATCHAHRLVVNAIAFHPIAPYIASASADATLVLWNLSGEKIRTFTGHTQAVRAIAFSPSGQLLASGGEDKTIRLWNLASGQCLQILSGHSWSVVALTFATNDWLISGSWDTTLKVWQVETGAVVAQLTGHTDSITSVALQTGPSDSAIAPTLHDALLVSGSRDCTIKRWQFSTDFPGSSATLT